MDLYEYQARSLYPKYGVPTTDGVVVASGDEAFDAALALGPGPVVVKAQVKVGGRGKAGGVKIAPDAGAARAQAEAILGMTIKGHTVRRVMVTRAVDIAAEYYVSLLVDRANRAYLALVSAEGGIDIETLAVQRPDALVRREIDPLVGFDAATAGELVAAAGFDPAVAGQVAETLVKLWELMRGEDATLVEVNPLVVTRDGRLVALDGKVTLDDNAAFRHPDHAEFIDMEENGPLEAKAKAAGLGYVKLDGQVGVIGNGAGLVMATLDVVAGAGTRYGGVRPANFLDIGGGASAAVMTDGLSIVLGDPQVRSVLVNVFGGITACDEVARGIVAAVDLLGPAADKPIVVRLDGNAVTAGRAILARADLPRVQMASAMEDAADLAAQLASTAGTRG
ncbi:MAG: ADP-forming succinate--CoA ligase subunit beta [Bifidobacteriaceae bacterium]|jgi:succinyl-CoA synthetase beta subunit|nr:ADP-forming succinate--CoA ligase subunit beta [Bifidobacteriaceae bacterium]